MTCSAIHSTMPSKIPIGGLRRCPLAAGEEGRHIGHDKAQAVEDDPGDDDALQPGPGLVYGAPGAGEVHHQQRNGGSNDGGDGGDGQDLGVDVFHDLAGLLPDRGGRHSLLAQ